VGKAGQVLVKTTLANIVPGASGRRANANRNRRICLCQRPLHGYRAHSLGARRCL